MINKIISKIFDELRIVFSGIDEDSAEKIIEEIIKAKRIFLAGRGRSGLMASAFAMRLMQLGFESHVVGESTTPAIKKKDLLIVISGSGMTETIYDIVEEAKNLDVYVCCITAKKTSKIAKKSDLVVYIPSKTKFGNKKSIQPLASSFEQAVLIYLDSLIVLLMKKTKKHGDELEKKHAVLE